MKFSENKILGYIPGAIKNKCFFCGRKYYADYKSVSCKPCAETMKAEFDSLFPVQQEQRLKDMESYLSGIVINIAIII